MDHLIPVEQSGTVFDQKGHLIHDRLEQRAQTVILPAAGRHEKDSLFVGGANLLKDGIGNDGGLLRPRIR